MLNQEKIILTKDWLKAKLKKSKKQRIKDEKRRKISHNKWAKKLIRRYQSENKGQNPLPLIPDNTPYCYHYISFNYDKDTDKPIIKTVLCPFWYAIEIPDDELDDCIGIVAENQTHIGGCKLLKETDNDMGGWGLLWDQCKECGLKDER
jgi:hypothetical protein